MTQVIVALQVQAGEKDQVNTFVKIICVEKLKGKFYRYSMET